MSVDNDGTRALGGLMEVAVRRILGGAPEPGVAEAEGGAREMESAPLVVKNIIEPEGGNERPGPGGADGSAGRCGGPGDSAGATAGRGKAPGDPGRGGVERYTGQD